MIEGEREIKIISIISTNNYLFYYVVLLAREHLTFDICPMFSLVHSVRN